MGAADFGLVLSVHDAVTVHVDKLQVTRLDTGALERVLSLAAAVGVQVVLQVGSVLDDAVGLVAIEVADGVAFFHAGHDTGVLSDEVVTAFNEVVGVVHLGHLVLVVSQVHVDTVLEVADVVVPSDGSLNTGVLHGAGVSIVTVLTYDSPNGNPQQEVLGLLLVPFERGAQTAAEEACVETDVDLFRCLPCQFGVGQTCGITTLCVAVLVVVERILTVVTEVEGRLPLCGRNVVVTVLSPAGAQFQELEP